MSRGLGDVYKRQFKECVIAHWSSDCAPKMSGAKRDTEAMGASEEDAR